MEVAGFWIGEYAYDNVRGGIICGGWTIGSSMQTGNFKMTRAVEQKPKAKAKNEEELII